jgi:uncharacterized protein
MKIWLRAQLARRPWWMNILMFCCAGLAGVYIPWDFFCKPVGADAEAWFGILLHGWAAKATEPLHWAIYLAGTYGFWRMRSWMWPWAAAYAAQLAIGFLVWEIAYKGGMTGWLVGPGSFLACAWLAYALWTAQDRFDDRRRPLRERYGEWALVTGASAGIGTAFARALAHEGFSCILTARRQERLDALAAELEEQYKVATRTVAADLSVPGGVARLLEAVADLEVDFLVNNAGFGSAGHFDKQDCERLQQMVHLNCIAPVLITRHLLPGMVARGRGAVVVTGSVAGALSVPYHGVYSATKAFDRAFGESLWAEMLGSGVDVLVLEPGTTDTDFQAIAGETARSGEPPEKVVKVALDALGRQPSVVSGWHNWLLVTGTRFLPRSVIALLVGSVMSRWVRLDIR